MIHKEFATVKPITPPRRTAALGLLGIVWATSLIILASPLAGTLLLKAVFLAIPVGLSVLVTLSQPRQGLLVWSFGLALLATQTGFQIDVGPVRTSALEVATVFLLLVLLFVRRRHDWASELQLPGQRVFALFAVYALIMLLISLIQATPLSLAVVQFKGFLLYPLMALLLLAGLSSRQALRLLVIILVVWYLFWGAQGILQFLREAAASGFNFRASAEYAPINIYGVTLAAVSMFLIGFAEHAPRSLHKILIHTLALFLFMAATASLSRTMWVAFLFGLIVLLVLGQMPKRNLLLWCALIVLFTFVLLPPEARDIHLLQVEDSSTQRRTAYLFSGFQAFKARFVTGWGWGRAFAYTGLPSTQFLSWSEFLAPAAPGTLIPTNSLPWYHNDYLNLAVQAGLIGLTLYLAFWHRVFAASRRWLHMHAGSHTRGYVTGSAAALSVILASGLFEHTLWRTDSAGLIGLFLGLMLAAMHLGTAEPT